MFADAFWKLGVFVSVCLHRQVHLGSDHTTFRYRKELSEERQKAQDKYKVSMAANSLSFISHVFLTPAVCAIAKSGERTRTEKLRDHRPLNVRALARLACVRPRLSPERRAWGGEAWHRSVKAGA